MPQTTSGNPPATPTGPAVTSTKTVTQTKTTTARTARKAPIPATPAASAPYNTTPPAASSEPKGLKKVWIKTKTFGTDNGKTIVLVLIVGALLMAFLIASLLGTRTAVSQTNQKTSVSILNHIDTTASEMKAIVVGKFDEIKTELVAILKNQDDMEKRIDSRIDRLAEGFCAGKDEIQSLAQKIDSYKADSDKRFETLTKSVGEVNANVTQVAEKMSVLPTVLAPVIVPPPSPAPPAPEPIAVKVVEEAPKEIESAIPNETEVYVDKQTGFRWRKHSLAKFEQSKKYSADKVGANLVTVTNSPDVIVRIFLKHWNPLTGKEWIDTRLPLRIEEVRKASKIQYFSDKRDIEVWESDGKVHKK